MGRSLLGDHQRWSRESNFVGAPREVPIDLSRTVGQHSLNSMIGDHIQRHPDSDLVAVLTGKKPFKKVLG
jgi:hypothetical protein